MVAIYVTFWQRTWICFFPYPKTLQEAELESDGQLICQGKFKDGLKFRLWCEFCWLTRFQSISGKGQRRKAWETCTLIREKSVKLGPKVSEDICVITKKLSVFYQDNRDVVLSISRLRQFTYHRHKNIKEKTHLTHMPLRRQCLQSSQRICSTILSRELKANVVQVVLATTPAGSRLWHHPCDASCSCRMQLL